jgi:hypothetical protein
MIGRRARAAAIAGLLLAGAAGNSGAQTDPGSVARAVLAADSAGDWPALLRLAHPDALREFRSFQVFQLRMMGDTAGRPDDSSDSWADSAQHRRFAERRIRYQRKLLDSVFRVGDVGALSRLAPDSVFARWMRATRPAADSSTPPRARVVGVLPANDTLAYAVVVRTIPRLPEQFRDLPQPEESPEVMVLRRADGQWRSMLNGTLLGDVGIAEDPVSGD